eukprot:5822389-Pleurochrysis_carterae.AAC.1
MYSCPPPPTDLLPQTRRNGGDSLSDRAVSSDYAPEFVHRRCFGRLQTKYLPVFVMPQTRFRRLCRIRYAHKCAHTHASKLTRPNKRMSEASSPRPRAREWFGPGMRWCADLLGRVSARRLRAPPEGSASHR